MDEQAIPPKVPPKYAKEIVEIPVITERAKREEEERRRREEEERKKTRRIEEIYMMLGSILTGYGWGRGWSAEIIKEKAEAWKPALKEKAKEIAEEKITLEDVKKWMREIVFEPIPERRPPEEEEELLEFMYLPTAERRRAIRKMFKRYWSEIVSIGLSNFFERHPEYGIGFVIHDTRNQIVKVAYDMLRARKPKTIQEWVISGFPMAKVAIDLMFEEGIHGDGFQNGFKERMYPSRCFGEGKPTPEGMIYNKSIKSEAERIAGRPVSAEEFMESFKEAILKLYKRKGG